jgi:hypothetical protein
MADKKDDEKGTNAKVRSARKKTADGRREMEREMVDRLLEELDQKIQAEGFKPAVADLIRLLTLQRELEDERPKEITVTWVDPTTDGAEPSGG